MKANQTRDQKNIMSICLLIFCFVQTIGLQAQGFIERTNKIHLNFKEAGVASALPRIDWINPAISSVFSEEHSLQLEANVYSPVPLSKVVLAVVQDGEERRERSYSISPGQLSQEIKLSMRLNDGPNTIEIIAENEKGGKVSDVRYVMIGKDNIASAIDLNRKDYALIFATDRYDHWDDLNNPVFDAQTIAQLLKDKYGFEVEFIQDATHEEMAAKISEYNQKKFNPQDQLFVFFAGHGMFDDNLGEGYVVASNSLLNDPGRTTYISHNILRSRIDNIKCEHIMLVMDVCFGGTFDPAIARSRSADAYEEVTDTELLVRKLSKRTRKYITSGGKLYVSDGIAGKHSPFAARFIQALRDVGLGDDRLVTIDELKPFLMKLSTEARYGSFGSDDPASDFVFVLKQ